MKYKKLSSLYYQDKILYEKTYESRFQNECAFHLPLEINKHPSFFVNTLEISNLIESIYSLNQVISNLSENVPTVAIRQLVKKYLIDEIVLTNGIEGVYSTRKEIKDAMRSDHLEDKKVRFKGLAQKYIRILENKKIELNNCNDIRSLYDDLVYSEIEPNNIPDGKIFRKGPVSIATVTDKEIHRGIMPENELISFMERALGIVNDENDIPFLIKVAIFHYLFGYAHPFYDGNGRTSRFISSYLLSKRLDILISIRISYIIKDDIHKYYKAFETCNEPKNRGDLTFFIVSFLKIIQKSAVNIIDQLNESIDRMVYYDAIISQQDFIPVEENVIFLLVQGTLFSEDGVDIEDISNHIKKGTQSARNIISKLQDDQVPIIINKIGHKNYYNLDLEQFENIFHNKKAAQG